MPINRLSALISEGGPGSKTEPGWEDPPKLYKPISGYSSSQTLLYILLSLDLSPPFFLFLFFLPISS